MTRARPLPKPLDTVAFSTAEAIDHGVSRGRLRASDLRTPYYGVRSTAPAAGLERRCLDYLVRMAPDQFFSHTTAALLLGLPLSRQLEVAPVIHVSGRSVRPRTAGVVGHRAVDTPATLLRGIPITDPRWVLAELGTLLDFDGLVVVGDALVRRKHPPTTLPELHATLDGLDRRGIRTVRMALELVRPRTDSPMETRLRLLITRSGLPEPLVGFAVRDAAGRFVGTPDLSYPHARIAIEYEGDIHRNDPRVFAADIERRERMQEAGWYVIRVLKNHVFGTPTELVARIARALESRG